MKKVLGVVVEFNPLHNGHMYFIQKAQELVQPDVTIAVMSSSFTMRGDISVINKYERTKLMLQANIDLVLELPFLACVQSSDYFTANAILTLRDFGVTDLVFGAELACKESLDKIHAIKKASFFDDIIKEQLSKGHSYRAAAFGAFQALTNDKTLIEQVTKPNNMLATGYIDAIHKFAPHINYHPIQRIKADYYEQSLSDQTIASADAIRSALRNKEDIASYIPSITALSYFIDETKAKESLFSFLQALFIRESLDSFEAILGVSEGIHRRINTMLQKATSYDELVDLTKTRRYTPNKIKRLLLHLALATPKSLENQNHYYHRVLGMSQLGEKYIRFLPVQIKKQIITSPKNINNCVIIEYENKATQLYQFLTKDNTIISCEYSLPIKKER